MLRYELKKHIKKIKVLNSKSKENDSNKLLKLTIFNILN